MRGESLLLEIILCHVWRGDGKLVQRPLSLSVSLELDNSLFLDFLVHAYVEEVARIVGNAETNGCGFRLWRRANDQFQLGLQNSQFPQTRSISHYHFSNAFLDFGRIHYDARYEIQENVVAVSVLGIAVREGNFKFVH